MEEGGVLKNRDDKPKVPGIYIKGLSPGYFMCLYFGIYICFLSIGFA